MKNEDVYLTDNPISKKSDDKLDRWAFAERIAHTIGQREDSGGLTIALYGEWGNGKTSTLNLMENVIKKEYDDIVVTRFNPWFFQSSPELIAGFFNHLAESIGKAMPTASEQALNAVKRYGGMLATISRAVAIGGVSINPAAIQDSADDMASEPTLHKLRERIKKLLRSADKRIVVLVDDIDRLDKEEIQQMFKLVRLSGNFEKVTYVLAFDEKMVAAALNEKYTAAEGDSGLRFVEKIIQVPLHLPPADKSALQNAIFVEINKTLKTENIELSERDSSAVAYEFQTSLGYALKTPRQVKRYANAVMFAVPILKDEVSIADLLLIEAIRIFYPEIYTTIRDNSEAFLSDDSSRGGARDKDKANIMEHLYDGVQSENQKRTLEHLVKSLFPRTETNGSYGDSWEKTWAEEKRICSRSYFRRYFNYGVPRGDISDVTFQSFIDEVDKASDEGTLDESVKKFIKKYGATAFMEKLVLLENTYNSNLAKKLAQGIAKNGALFEDNGDLFFSDFSRAATFIARVHAKITPVSKQDDFATDILSVATPLPFAVEEFIFMSRDEKTPEEKQTMTAETEKRLGKDLAERIAKESSRKPPHLFKRGSARLIWHWKTYAKKDDVRKYFKNRLTKKPSEVGDFLASFVGMSYGSDGKRLSDLRSNDFDAITELVSADDLIKIIKKSPLGKTLNTEDVHFNRKLTDKQRLANQFVNINESKKDAARTEKTKPKKKQVK